MLKIGATEEWRDILPNVRVLFAPIGIKAVRAARRAAASAFGTDPEDAEEVLDSLRRELLRRGIRGWEGVGDGAGELIEFTLDHLEAFLADPIAFEAARNVYLSDWEAAEAEKNAYAGSSRGTSVAAMPENATASSSANAASTADAPLTQMAKPKKRATVARTSRTNSRRKKPNSSSM